jgi:hypothetical protein
MARLSLAKQHLNESGVSVPSIRDAGAEGVDRLEHGALAGVAVHRLALIGRQVLGR